MPELITPEESVRLIALERVIEKGRDTFVDVGNALAEIRDSRIYRSSHGNFEDYCRERWQFSKTQCNRLIESAKVVENLTPNGVTPFTESQARPLAKLPAEQQPAAWEKAQEIAAEEGKPVAARHVEKAVKDHQKAKGVETTTRKPAIPSREDIEQDQRRILGNLKSAWVAAPTAIRNEFLAWVDSTKVSTMA
jgi:hypothetical protein